MTRSQRRTHLCDEILLEHYLSRKGKGSVTRLQVGLGLGKLELVEAWYERVTSAGTDGTAGVVPSPVYQCRKALRLNMAENWA
jgi:hypothetical protein